MLCFLFYVLEFFHNSIYFLCLLILECKKFYPRFAFVTKQDELILLGSQPVYLDAVRIFPYLKLKNCLPASTLKGLWREPSGKECHPWELSSQCFPKPLSQGAEGYLAYVLTLFVASGQTGCGLAILLRVKSSVSERSLPTRLKILPLYMPRTISMSIGKGDSEVWANSPLLPETVLGYLLLHENTQVLRYKTTTIIYYYSLSWFWLLTGLGKLFLLRLSPGCQETGMMLALESSWKLPHSCV